MIKGYLTVFLSLSLSVLIGFVLLLTGGAIRNGEKVRLECAVDTGMNATLGEYHIGLLEKYDLLYIDTSYLGVEPSAENLRNRLLFYVSENADPSWGEVVIEKVEILSLETAAADQGASMRSQAIKYMQDKGAADASNAVLAHLEEIRYLDAQDSMQQWKSLMEQIEGMELPKVQNEQGVWEEIPLSNPADTIYGLCGSDIFYLAEVDLSSVSGAGLSLADYISHRQLQNTQSMNAQYENDDGAFLSYLFEKMGYLKNPAAGSLLSCQLEYAAYGKQSDWENVRSTGERLFRWRFADNLSCAFSDGSLRAQAAVAADQLTVVRMSPEFKEPVIESILYACAFLESVNDIRVIYQDGSVPVRKSSHQMSVSYVLNGGVYHAPVDGGFSYKEYLGGMLLLLEQKMLNLRVMDIMEMEMRILDGNSNFAMDWCVERYQAKITARSNYGDTWYLTRKYGYF